MHIMFYDICSVVIVQCQTNCLCLNFLSCHDSMIKAMPVAVALAIDIVIEDFYV